MKKIMKNLDMICWHDKEGVVKPIKFRFFDDRGDMHIIKVDKIIKEDVNNFAGNTIKEYECQALINANDKRFKLRYEIKSQKWFLDKI